MESVRIGELKARLSEYLRRVRRGRTLIVTDRETPIAQIVPYQADAASLTVRHPMPDAPRLAAIRMPPPLAIRVDVVQLLAKERDDRGLLISTLRSSCVLCLGNAGRSASGTLDAIHLATALLWRERSDADLLMATHDATLGLAARAVGFRVIGL
jgi:prevent-host-death family protein